ncbi:hypothetical protein [Fusobacterium necrophorum]|uniref:hypothetical protein n=1 Tax=Fusobacterium necrophorum TaxID=859 RepID=UPI00243256D9|nr:hypothetical protein [Fusobacterium necrophorum]MCF0162990.1 hypothetical protein [Fusobacterium necrophorum]MDK4476202.1 hypothetical protein [Fusobacterium necrophorum]
MQAKIGRPKSKNPRNKRLEIKLTEEELEKINKCSSILKKTRTDTILLGISKIEEEIKK